MQCLEFEPRTLKKSMLAQLLMKKNVSAQFFLFLWWSEFEPRTLHILCFVYIN